jgi:hypothetical protein
MPDPMSLEREREKERLSLHYKMYTLARLPRPHPPWSGLQLEWQESPVLQSGVALRAGPSQVLVPWDSLLLPSFNLTNSSPVDMYITCEIN